MLQLRTQSLPQLSASFWGLSRSQVVTVPVPVTEMASQGAAGLGGPQNVTLGLQQRCFIFVQKSKGKTTFLCFLKTKQKKKQPFERLTGSTKGLSLPGEFTDLG